MNLDSRQERGLEISKHSTLRENEDGSFSVPSQAEEGRSYAVKLFGNEWTCDCPDFVNRCDAINACKHIHAVRFWIAAKTELRNEPKPKVFSEDAVQCVKCGSIRVVKFGNYNGKQLFKCKDCRTKFREGLIKKSRYTSETIALTLDLYFSGLSLRKITRTLNDHFDLTMGATTVYDWIQRFVPLISEFANSLSPQLSETWHADELFVKMKGGVSNTSNAKNLAFLWNVMDRKTRFLLASKLSKFRDGIGGERALKEAVNNAHGSQPERVLTDSLPAYNDAMKFAFKGKVAPSHIAKAGIKKPHANNNRIERMNGTLRERVKVQRGWKSMESSIAEGQRIHYNFVKPHSSLDGQTPAHVAGIGIDRRNKWMGLLSEALKKQ